MEIVTSWMEKGLEQGPTSRDGRKASARCFCVSSASGWAILIRQWKSRSRAYRPTASKQLGEALLDFNSLADLEPGCNRIGRRRPSAVPAATQAEGGELICFCSRHRSGPCCRLQLALCRSGVCSRNSVARGKKCLPIRPPVNAIDGQVCFGLGRPWASSCRLLIVQCSELGSRDRMIDVAREKLAGDRVRLRNLLVESRKRLAPLEDPFDVDLCCIAGSRRTGEAYSDWLEWVIGQMSRWPQASI